MIRHFCDCDSHEKKAQIVSVTLLFSSVIAITGCLILFGLSHFLTNVVMPIPAHTNSFRIMVLFLPFACTMLLCLNILKITFAKKPFAIISLGSAFITVGLALVFVLRFNAGINSIFIAQLISAALFSAISLFFCRSYFVWPKSFRYILPSFNYGWPVMLTMAAAALLPVIDRTVIVHYLNLEVLGLYAVASKLAMIVRLPISAFQMAWDPFSLSIYKDHDANDVYKKIFLYYVLLLSLIVYLLILFARPILLVMASKKYLGAELIMLPLIFGILFESVGSLAGIGIVLSKKTYLNLIGNFVGIITGLSIMLLFIKPFGVMGVAYGILSAQLIRSVVTAALAYKVYHVRFAWQAPIIVILIVFVITHALNLFLRETLYLYFAVGSSLLFLLMGCAYKWIIPNEDKISIRNMKLRFLKTKPMEL